MGEKGPHYVLKDNGRKTKMYRLPWSKTKVIRLLSLFLIPLSLLCVLSGCRQDIVSEDVNMRLSFSHDSVLFDTVFTSMGSSTRRVMVYNRNANAVVIERVLLQDGRYFHINLDGENRTENLRDIPLRGGDSLFMFVRVNIDPQAQNTPVLVTDTVSFRVNGKVQQMSLQAYGQNVEIVRSPSGLVVWENATLTSERPYLIYDTVVVQGDLSIEAGSTLYMSNNALLHVYGNLTAMGSVEEPITIRGARTDRLFDSVPYRVASGQWNGIYLLSDGSQPAPTYMMNHVDICSGTCGLYVSWEPGPHSVLQEQGPHSVLQDNGAKTQMFCLPHQSEHISLSSLFLAPYSQKNPPTQRPNGATPNGVHPTLFFLNSRIHNHSAYGMVLLNVDATVINSEISNCASYCVYLSGGTHRFVHTTVASYFGYPYTNINIHNGVHRDSVIAVFINNLDKDMLPTASSFNSCIIAGARTNNLRVATPLTNYYEGSFSGNYLQADSLPASYAANNVYGSKTDTVFRNIYYRVGEYRYYDFRLDSLSPARSIGDTLVMEPRPAALFGTRTASLQEQGAKTQMFTTDVADKSNTSIVLTPYSIINIDSLLWYDRVGHRRKPRPDAGCYEYLF